MPPPPPVAILVLAAPRAGAGTGVKPVKHVKRFDTEDFYAFAGAVDFPDGGKPLTWEGTVWIEGSRRWVKMVGCVEGVEFHWEVDGDPRMLASSTDRACFREYEIDALVGLVKELGSLDLLLRLGFVDLMEDGAPRGLTTH